MTTQTATLRLTPTQRDTLRAALIADCESRLAAFPQYQGHFAQGWVLKTVVRSITTKAGHAFSRGQIVLAKYQGNDPLRAQYPDLSEWSVWSHKLGHFVGLADRDMGFVPSLPQPDYDPADAD